MSNGKGVVLGYLLVLASIAGATMVAQVAQRRDRPVDGTKSAQRLLICDQESLTEEERPALNPPADLPNEVETVRVFGHCWDRTGAEVTDIRVEMAD